MAGETEIENAALESNIRELSSLRKDGTAQAGERALKLASDCVGILFKGEPEPPTEEGKLAKAAGEARFAAGRKVQIWGTEGKWSVWIDGNDTDKADPNLEEKRQLIQKACDAGLRNQSGEVASNIAVTEVAKVKVEEDLLSMAGGRDLSTPREKADVIRPRLVELHSKEQQARYWMLTNRTNFDEVPQVARLHETRDKVRSTN